MDIELYSRLGRIEQAIKRLIRCVIGGALTMSGAIYLHFPLWSCFLLVALTGFALGLRK